MSQLSTPRIGSRWRQGADRHSMHIEPGHIYTVDGNRVHPSPRLGQVIHTVTFKELPGKLYSIEVLRDMTEIKISEKLELI
jgi:hypothetical protein